MMRVSVTVRAIFSGDWAEPGCDELDDGWRSHHTNDGDHRQADQQQLQGTHRQPQAILAVPVGHGFGKHGHESDTQGSLTEQPAQQIGDPKRGDKGIRRHPGTKKRSQHHIPDVAEDAAEKRCHSHHAGGPGDLSVLTFWSGVRFRIHMALLLGLEAQKPLTCPGFLAIKKFCVFPINFRKEYRRWQTINQH
jgi:hypothetical protein